MSYNRTARFHKDTAFWVQKALKPKNATKQKAEPLILSPAAAVIFEELLIKNESIFRLVLFGTKVKTAKVFE